MVRRIIGARVSDPTAADDLVQETLVRVLGAAGRIEPGMIEPYAYLDPWGLSRAFRQNRQRGKQAHDLAGCPAT